jgi:hypothetical protein
MLLIPRHPIVDTGPLFDYLLWQFSCSPHFRKAGRSLAFRYLQNEPYKEAVRCTSQWHGRLSPVPRSLLRFIGMQKNSWVRRTLDISGDLFNFN